MSAFKYHDNYFVMQSVIKVYVSFFTMEKYILYVIYLVFAQCIFGNMNMVLSEAKCNYTLNCIVCVVLYVISNKSDCY